MNLHHCPYTGYESPSGEKEMEREGRGKKGSSHGICFKIQLVVNISPDRITLKPPTAVPTVSQRCFATMRRRKLSGSLEIPMI